MKNKGHLIKSVDPGSIAEQMELEAGDILLTLNDEPIEDIFDYQYKLNNDCVTAVVLKKNGEEWELDIENDYQDLGLNFENGLMSDYRSCSNRCIFCFIDQMPPGMRETLYFKDDDSRLSFLQGNYVTLTNLSDHDLQRIIQFHLAPINISVHTTNPELRCMMLHNRFAGKALEKIKVLYDAEIPMNGQIVCCPGINDGRELERTIKDLSGYLPYMESLSVVPVGLSKYREGLYPLEPFDKESACRVIDIVEAWQERLYREHGSHFVHASDELYLLAERELPEAERYDGYIQLENGVGMLRLLMEETEEALSGLQDDGRREKLTIATGKLAAPFMERIAGKIKEIFPGREIQVIPIENRFFGERITVSGLITGQDLAGQLADKELGARLVLPCSMFRSGEEVFLDDMTKTELSERLSVPIEIAPSEGAALIRLLLDPAAEEDRAWGSGIYEPESEEEIGSENGGLA
ncbi:MAG: DUF512 domain-containing protein [Clostridium sp.]|nr:DUF512 domain-containing protein [Clostridium sp.]